MALRLPPGPGYHRAVAGVTVMRAAGADSPSDSESRPGAITDDRMLEPGPAARTRTFDQSPPSGQVEMVSAWIANVLQEANEHSISIIQLFFAFAAGIMVGIFFTVLCFMTNPRIARKYYARVNKLEKRIASVSKSQPQNGAPEKPASKVLIPRKKTD